MLRAARLRFTVVILAILVAAPSATRADEPVKPLSTSTNTTSSVTNSINPAQAISVSQSNSVLISLSQPAGTTNVVGIANQPSADDLSATASVVVVIQKRSEVEALSTQSGKGSLGFANIEAGYGQVYDNDSIVLRGRNGTAWEETRYVFIKKVIKF